MRDFSKSLMVCNTKYVLKNPNIGALQGGQWTSALPHKDLKMEAEKIKGMPLTASEIMSKLRISSQFWSFIKDKHFDKVD